MKTSTSPEVERALKRSRAFGSLCRWLCASFVLGALLSTSLKANAAVAHETMFGVDFNNNLLSFYSDAPGTIVQSHAITGLSTGEEVRGIDYWNGTIYAMGGSSRLYSISPNTGAATAIGGQFVPILNGSAFGTDNGPTGFRVLSDLGQHLLIDRNTGAATVGASLSYAAGDPRFGQAPTITALAYDDANGNWYGADSVANSLARLDPATGLLNTIGATGIDFSRFNGLDIAVSPGSDTMYLVSPAASSDPAANLYTVNKLTGAVTLVGLIGHPGDNILVRGMTVVPVPEPTSLVLLILGTLGSRYAVRRRG